MYVESININGLRNLRKTQLAPAPGINIIIGENGQGKTNILEGIYLLAFGKSFRTNKTESLLNREGKTTATIRAKLTKEKSRNLELEIAIEDGKKSVKRNGAEIKKLSTYIGSLPVVFFSPQDMALIQGAPQERRKFLNTIISQLDYNYMMSLTKYNLVIKNRNTLLKNGNIQPKLLDVINEQLLREAMVIWKKREEYIIKLEKLTESIYNKLVEKEEKIKISYKTTVSATNEINSAQLNLTPAFALDCMHKMYGNEKQRKQTLFGPHRDDFKIYVSDRDVHEYGSQGEQRSIVLALKLAELELINNEIGEYPILLLDDVLSELDNTRQVKLIMNLLDKGQTFITATDINNFQLEEKKIFSIFRITQGVIENE